MQPTRPQDVLITEAFADFMEKCKAKNLSEKTLGIYQVHFRYSPHGSHRYAVVK